MGSLPCSIGNCVVAIHSPGRKNEQYGSGRIIGDGFGRYIVSLEADPDESSCGRIVNTNAGFVSNINPVLLIDRQVAEVVIFKTVAVAVIMQKVFELIPVKTAQSVFSSNP